jgi:dCMP deaminase
MSSENSRLSKKSYYLEMLKLVANRSTCIRRKVAAIITDRDGHVLSTGYNGVPRNFEHCIDIPCSGAGDKPGDNTKCMAVHAEQNALLQCNDLDKAYVLYCSCVPCFSCAKMIANTNIALVICVENYADKAGQELLIEAGIILEVSGVILEETT